jgi:hypothetical protein
MNIDLDGLLDRHARYLNNAVAGLPPGADLPPILVGFKDETAIPFGWLTTLPKDTALALFGSMLRRLGADGYVVMTPGWYIALDTDAAAPATIAIARREGLAGQLKDRPRECYTIFAGDRHGTKMAAYDVHRDATGKIRRLTRVATDHQEAAFGRMVNLLVHETVH